MKKKFFSVATLAVAAAFVCEGADTDPVLMTVDGHDVRVSEFEYLYNKNNAQQASPQSVDDYLNMFVNYKLKVAEAEREGLDKRPEFMQEYNEFRAELSKPYFHSHAVEDRMVAEAYSHYKDDVKVSHIMLPVRPGNDHTLDSLRTAILSGNTTFEDAAARYSVDRGSRTRGGDIGYVVPGRYPWAFEEAAYATASGAISPVVNSGMGYHIIRVDSRRPAQGEVNADHILLMTQGKNDQEKARAKILADSLYEAVRTGADFGELAGRYSEDPGSAKRGGNLGWFGRGMMVAEFDSVSFALPDGAVSEPFATRFGYHIVRRNGHRGVPSLSDVRPAILQAMQKDGRGRIAEKHVQDSLAALYGVKLDKALLAGIDDMIMSSPTACDTAVYNRIVNMKTPVITVGDTDIYFLDFMGNVDMRKLVSMPAPQAVATVNEAAEEAYGKLVMDVARDHLAQDNADYRNLINEYRDGILLYEISNRNVWERASKDHEGLEAYFKAHADRYRWDVPKYKAIIVFAKSDSILSEAVAYAGAHEEMSLEKLQEALRKQFGKSVKVDRVIAGKGENPITDYLGFGAEKPSSELHPQWAYYTAVRGKVLDAPEEAADVRGAALVDYQTELDRRWVDELHKKYKVNINKKVLSRLKKQK